MSLSPTGIEAVQGGDAARNVIASYWLSGQNIKVYDDVVTTVTAYHGMSETDAAAKAATLDANTMADYRIRSSSTSPYNWISCPMAKGTITKASYQRVGNSRMFTVTATTETHTCTNSAGWVEF